MMDKKNPRLAGIRRLLPVVLLTLAGALGGYLYYRYVGCASGTCPITSSPYISSIYGAIIGALLGSSFTPAGKKGGKTGDGA